MLRWPSPSQASLAVLLTPGAIEGDRVEDRAITLTENVAERDFLNRRRQSVRFRNV